MKNFSKREPLPQVVLDVTHEEGADNPNATHFVRTCMWEDFEISMIRSKKLPENFPFLPAKVKQHNILWWDYGRDHKGFSGCAHLVQSEKHGLIIILTNRDGDDLHDVLPVKYLPSMSKANDGFWMGGLKLSELVKLKEEISIKYKLVALWDQREKPLVDIQDQELREKKAKRKEAEEAERLAEAEERRERRGKIETRKRVNVFNESDERRSGIPVVGNEWECLRNDTRCISVESFNEETGVAGKPIESFVVMKEGSKLKRARVELVFIESLKRHAQVALVQRIYPKIKGKVEEVLLLADINAVHALHNSGMNGGNLVGCPVKEGDGELIHVFSLSNKEVKPIAKLKETPNPKAGASVQ